MNKIPARVRPGRGHRVAGLSSRNRDDIVICQNGIVAYWFSQPILK
jgi:hypothetical protein